MQPVVTLLSIFRALQQLLHINVFLLAAVVVIVVIIAVIVIIVVLAYLALFQGAGNAVEFCRLHIQRTACTDVAAQSNSAALCDIAVVIGICYGKGIALDGESTVPAVNRFQISYFKFK